MRIQLNLVLFIAGAALVAAACSGTGSVTIGDEGGTGPTDGNVRPDVGSSGTGPGSEGGLKRDGGSGTGTGTGGGSGSGSGAGDAGSGSGSSTGTGTGTGGGSGCVNPANDCPATGTLCIVASCVAAACTTNNALQGAACQDHGGKVCDGNGNCIGCNGTGDCTPPNVCLGSTCVAPTCTDGIQDGNETDTDCGGNVCPACPDFDMCLVASDCQSGDCDSDECTPCGQDTDCGSNQYCDPDNNGGTCTPTNPVGTACQENDECTLGNCVDGVCCNTACADACTACTAALKGGGHDGTCGPVTAGTDPLGSCNDDGPQSCGTNGLCNGSGGCSDYPAGTVCVMAGCEGNFVVSQGTCNGTGTCGGSAFTNCSPYACSGTTCDTSCTKNSQCAAGYYCSAEGACIVDIVTGGACSTAGECQSRSCVDGVCCDFACTGTCEGCTTALTGQANGQCANVLAGLPPVPASQCPAAETCNGSGACE